MPNIEELIRRAMEDGAFDNLQGTGKLINLEDNPYIDPSWQLAYHLLKENGFAPSFIETRQAIGTELAAPREALALAWRQSTLEERATGSGWKANGLGQ